METDVKLKVSVGVINPAKASIGLRGLVEPGSRRGEERALLQLQLKYAVATFVLLVDS
jgi:hypothetical protein